MICLLYILKWHLTDDLAHKKCFLTTLQKRLNIVSVYKNTLTFEEWAQAILNIKVNDIADKWEVLQVCQHLANHRVVIFMVWNHFQFLLKISKMLFISAIKQGHIFIITLSINLTIRWLVQKKKSCICHLTALALSISYTGTAIKRLVYKFWI